MNIEYNNSNTKKYMPCGMYFLVFELLYPIFILIIFIYDYGSHVKILLIIIYHYSALYQKLYIQSKSAPEDGRICCPKHVGLI